MFDRRVALRHSNPKLCHLLAELCAVIEQAAALAIVPLQRPLMEANEDPHPVANKFFAPRQHLVHGTEILIPAIQSVLQTIDASP